MKEHIHSHQFQDDVMFKAREFVSPFPKRTLPTSPTEKEHNKKDAGDDAIMYPSPYQYPNLEHYLSKISDMESPNLIYNITDNFPSLSTGNSQSPPLFDVYGTHECLGSDNEPNWSCIAVHDYPKSENPRQATEQNQGKQSHLYILFSGQTFSNFNAPEA